MDSQHINAPTTSAVCGSQMCIWAPAIKAAQLNDFLKRHRVEESHLVGDVIDGWRMKSGIYWNRDFTRVVRRLLKSRGYAHPLYYRQPRRILYNTPTTTSTTFISKTALFTRPLTVVVYSLFTAISSMAWPVFITGSSGWGTKAMIC